MPLLIVPSESYTREFDAKLLLACATAERGFQVVVGARAAIHNRAHAFPRGIYLAKDVRFSSRRIFSILRRLGHRIAAWDEEGLLYYSPDTYYRARIDPVAMAAVEQLFAWGEESAAVLRAAPGYAGVPVHATGNPRTDMMRPELRSLYEQEVSRLQERFGRFVLVNTNFGRLNHYLPGKSIVLPTAAGGPAKNIGAQDVPIAVWAYRKKLYDAFRIMVPALAAALPDLHIVLRPHPSENLDTWRADVAGAGNVTVIHEGNVVPWLLAAEAMIHNGCTTGFEASVVGTPAYAFQPFPPEGPELPLANALSTEAASVEALAGLVRQALTRSHAVSRSAEQERLIQRYVTALDGPLASDRIAEVLAAWSAQDGAQRAVSPIERMRGIAQSVHRATSKRLQSLVPSSRHHPVLRRHRFKDLSVAEVNDTITRFRSALSRFSTVQVREIGPNIFQVEDAGGPRTQVGQ